MKVPSRNSALLSITGTCTMTLLACILCAVSTAAVDDHVNLLPKEALATMSVSDYTEASKTWTLSTEEKKKEAAALMGLSSKELLSLETGRVTRCLLGADTWPDCHELAIIQIANTKKATALLQDKNAQPVAKETLPEDGPTIVQLATPEKAPPRFATVIPGNLVLADDPKLLLQVIQKASSSPAESDSKFSPDTLFPKRAKKDFASGSLQLTSTFFMNEIFSFAKKNAKSKEQKTYIEDILFSGMDQVVTAASRESYDPTSKTGHSICCLTNNSLTHGALAMLQLTPTTPESLAAPLPLPEDYDRIVLHGDVPRAFTFFGPVFDRNFAEGIKGTYDDLLEDLRSPDTLNIDLKKELYAYLGPQFLYARKATPATNGAHPFAIGIKTSDVKKVARALEILMKDDPEVKKITLAGQVHPIWEMPTTDKSLATCVTVAKDCFLYGHTIAVKEILKQEKPIAPDTVFTKELTAFAADFQLKKPSMRYRRAKKSDKPATPRIWQWLNTDSLAREINNSDFVSQEHSSYLPLGFRAIGYVQGNRWIILNSSEPVGEK